MQRPDCTGAPAAPIRPTVRPLRSNAVVPVLATSNHSRCASVASMTLAGLARNSLITSLPAAGLTIGRGAPLSSHIPVVGNPPHCELAAPGVPRSGAAGAAGLLYGAVASQKLLSVSLAVASIRSGSSWSD